MTLCGWRTVTGAPERDLAGERRDSAPQRRAWLGIGTNLGDRRANLCAALSALAGIADIDAVSAVYESEAVGVTEQPDFWNMVVRVRTALAPHPLLNALKTIEADLGRTPTVRWGPRLIDIDILLFEDDVVDDPALTIPHPRMLDRGFVMLPLMDLDPEMLHPLTGAAISRAGAGRTFERNRRLFPGSELIPVHD